MQVMGIEALAQGAQRLDVQRRAPQTGCLGLLLLLELDLLRQPEGKQISPIRPSNQKRQQQHQRLRSSLYQLLG